jgi:hypothetical protein
MCGLFYYLEHNTMPIPANIYDLSRIASENSPQGTETVKGTIDDYFRSSFSLTRQAYDAASGYTVPLLSAATVAIGFANSLNVTITGNATITSFDSVAEGIVRWVTFGGALILTYNAASMQLPGAANITTAAGDTALFKSLGGGNWKCLSYTRIGGEGVIQASTGRNGYLSAADWNAFNNKQPALGYTPYNETNPAGYLPAATAAATYLALAGGQVLTGNVTFSNNRGLLGTDGVGAVRPLLTTDTSGNVNIGNIGGQKIQFTNSAGGVIGSMAENGTFTAGVITETSDERKKKSWQRLPNDFIRKLAGIRKAGLFTWKRGGARGLGVGAQSLEAMLPEAVHTDEKGAKTVQYGAAALVASVELARAVVDLQARIVKLEAR